VTAIVLLFTCRAASASQAGQLGAGVILGSPTGLSVKYFLTDTHAVDAVLGEIGGNLSVHADFLWHAWDASPQPAAGRLGAYLGLGARLRDAREDVQVGVRAVAGGALRLRAHPVEIFAEVAPVFQLVPSDFVQLDGGVGVRFYFAGPGL
jgi:hypothetical protein